MGYIRFVDETGTVDFSNGLESVASGVGARFRGWTPFVRPVGPVETALGTGRPYQFVFRTDYGARFSIDEIPVTSLDDAVRLESWLIRGGSCIVFTSDSAGRTYNVCVLAPGTVPSISQQDPNELTYRFEVSLINVDDAPSAMLCEYSN